MFNCKILLEKNTLFKSEMVTDRDERRIFARYEKFFVQHLYSTATSFDECDKVNFNDPMKLKRFSKMFVLEILTLLFALRCIVNILYPTEYIRDLTCNGYHYFGNQLTINLGLLAGCITGSLMLGLWQKYSIFSGQSYSMKYMNKIKYKRFDYSLNERFNNKFYRKFNWISKGVNAIYLAVVIMGISTFSAPTIMGWFDPDINFNTFGERNTFNSYKH